MHVIDHLVQDLENVSHSLAISTQPLPQRLVTEWSRVSTTLLPDFNELSLSLKQEFRRIDERMRRDGNYQQTVEKMDEDDIKMLIRSIISLYGDASEERGAAEAAA